MCGDTSLGHLLTKDSKACMQYSLSSSSSSTLQNFTMRGMILSRCSPILWPAWRLQKIEKMNTRTIAIWKSVYENTPVLFHKNYHKNNMLKCMKDLFQHITNLFIMIIKCVNSSCVNSIFSLNAPSHYMDNSAQNHKDFNENDGSHERLSRKILLTFTSTLLYLYINMLRCYLIAPTHCMQALEDNSGGNHKYDFNENVWSHERLSGKILWTFISLYLYFIMLTLMLLMANLAITKLCKKPEK